MELVQSIRAPLDYVSEFRLQEMKKLGYMIARNLGILPQPPAQTCCRAPMALFMRIGA
jgi:hypothetical protein